MENELYHYGKLGMKWGVRKSRPKSSSVKKTKSSKKKSTPAKRKKILTDSRKQTLKKIGKTAAITAGSVAAAATLGTLGSIAFNTAMQNFNQSQTYIHNNMIPAEKRHGVISDTSIYRHKNKL